MSFFPVLQDQKLPCYKTVVGILHEAGHTVATESLVRSYFSVIRSRRGIPAKTHKAPLGVTPSVTLTRPARELRADPGVRVQATDRPVAQAVSVPSVEAVPGVVPVEVTDWHAESRRLESEPVGAPWTGADEWMWRFFLAKAAPRRLNLFTNAPDVEELLTISQRLCFTPSRRSSDPVNEKTCDLQVSFLVSLFKLPLDFLCGVHPQAFLKVRSIVNLVHSKGFPELSIRLS